MSDTATHPVFPVFYDPTARRRRYLNRAALALAIACTGLASVFIASVLVNPVLPRLNLPQLAALPNAAEAKPALPPIINNRAAQKAERAQIELKQAHQRHQQQAALTKPTNVVAPPRATTRPLALGFYVNWDDSRDQSLKRHRQQLDLKPRGV